MLHLLYILAFTALAFLAIGNLIRNLLTLGADSTRTYPPKLTDFNDGTSAFSTGVPHPEFLDDWGNVINEPLLVMRSITVEDAREKLDSLYNSSPQNSNSENREEN